MSNLNIQNSTINFVLVQDRKTKKWNCDFKSKVPALVLAAYNDFCNDVKWDTEFVKVAQMTDGKITFLDESEIWTLR